MLINKVLELKNIKGGNGSSCSGGGGNATLYFYSNDQYGGIYLFTPEVPADISKDTKCVSCESHGAYLAVTTIADNLYNSSSNVTYVDSTSFRYDEFTTFTRDSSRDVTVSSSGSVTPTPAGSSFCQFKAQYGGRGYTTAIVFSYDNVTSIQIESLENPSGYELYPNSGEHVSMVGEKVTSAKLVLADGTTVAGVELT